jgi:hypothetical protein
MEPRTVPQDDLLDVTEMTQNLEASISQILRENELSLAMSALMSAFINVMIAQCDTFDEVVFYRDIFMQILDNSIRSIKLKEK